ncbi:hypothetical protein [Roseivivax sp. CAU 1761]
MTKKSAAPEVSCEEPSAEDCIEQALIAAAETQPSWKHRCHAILAALGSDFGDPDWEMPEEARRKDMLIAALIENGSQVLDGALAWPRDPSETLKSDARVVGFGWHIPMSVAITASEDGGFCLDVDGERLPGPVATLQAAMERANAIYRARMNAALRERVTDKGGLKRRRLQWHDGEAWSPMGTFTVTSEDNAWRWHLKAHDGEQVGDACESERAAKLGAEQKLDRMLVSCFAMGEAPFERL